MCLLVEKRESRCYQNFMAILKRFIPVFILLVLLVAIYLLGLGEYFTFDYLQRNRRKLLLLVNAYPYLSPLAYILFYAFTVAIALPVAAFINLSGGFLFGAILGTVYAVIGATFGASILFLAVRYAFGERMGEKLGKRYIQIKKGFQKNGTWYLLFLRLIPLLFPFWAVNVASAALRVSFWTYFWTTLVGGIPSSFIYAEAGAGLGEIFDQHERFSLQAIFNWKIRIAFILLALLALVPIAVKKWDKLKK